MTQAKGFLLDILENVVGLNLTQNVLGNAGWPLKERFGERVWMTERH